MSTKRKETKEEFEARVVEGVRKAMRKVNDLVEAGRRDLEAARKEAKRLAQEDRLAAGVTTRGSLL